MSAASPSYPDLTAAALSALRGFYKALPMCGASEATLYAVMGRYFSPATVWHWGGGGGADVVGRDNIWRAMLPLIKAYPGATFREVLTASGALAAGAPAGSTTLAPGERGDVAFLLLEAVGAQNGSLYGVIPATGKTTCVPLFEAARMGADGKLAEVWTQLDKFMLIDQIGERAARAAAAGEDEEGGRSGARIRAAPAGRSSVGRITPLLRPSLLQAPLTS